jgi:hypothetical protein
MLFLSCSDDATVFVDAATDANTIDANSPLGMLPQSLDLGPGDCGGTATETFTVNNTGNATLEYSLELSDPTFTVVPTEGTVLAGTSTTFTVTAHVAANATAGTNLTATLTATTNLPGSPHTVPVVVTPHGAHITFTPPSVGFGQVEAGSTSAPSTVVVANTGNAQAMITIAAPPQGSDFARLFGTGGVITLQGGQNAVASFTYHPGAVGPDALAPVVTITGLQCGTAPSAIPLSGEGTITGGVLVQGGPIDFGAIDCGSTSGTATLTLMNTAALPANFSAAFVTDPDGDHLRYSVAPASGTVAANGSTTLTVTRLAIATPATPRAYDAILRVSTTLPVAHDTDVTVHQALTGPFLVATPTATNFGYASLGTTRTAPLSIQNTGNAAATLQSNTSAPFALQLPAMISSGETQPGTMTYTPAALGTTTGNATLDAPGACSAPLALGFTAGDGPELGYFYTYGASVTCPVTGQPSGPIYLNNTGNLPLSLTCAETGTLTNLAPQFSPSPLGVGVGSAGQVNVTVAAGSPVRAGTTAAQIRCTSNEPVGNTHDLSYNRTLDGADLTLAAAQPLEFTCGVTERKPYTITSAATSTRAVFVMPTSGLVFPLAHDFTQQNLDTGENYANDVTTYGGGSAMPSARLVGGVGDPCSGGGNPGDIVFTGSVGVGTGSSSGVCSVTPASLPVVLRQGTPAASATP